MAGDATGLGHNGALNGAAWTTFGRFGAALTFDGTNDFVTVADADDLDFTNGMTLSAWVFPTVHGSDWRTVMLKEQPGQLVYALYSNDGANRPSGHIYVGGDTDVRGTTAPPTNNWSYLAVTYDGSTLRLYVDATQVASRTVSGNVTVSSGQLRIGGNSIWTARSPPRRLRQA